MVNGRCRPVRHTQPALPLGLPVPTHWQVRDYSGSEVESEASNAPNSESDVYSDESD